MTWLAIAGKKGGPQDHLAAAQEAQGRQGFKGARIVQSNRNIQVQATNAKLAATAILRAILDKGVEREHSFHLAV